MTNTNFKGFSINIAKGKSKKNTITKFTKVSRLCKAIVTFNENNEYVATINLRNDETNPDTLIIPFTKQSYELQGKEYVFSKNKDEYNHYICHIRTKENATMFPGLDTQYSVFKPKMIVGGYIVRIEGKYYFDYTQFVSFSENHSDYIPLASNDNEPVFHKNKQ